MPLLTERQRNLHGHAQGPRRHHTNDAVMTARLSAIGSERLSFSLLVCYLLTLPTISYAQMHILTGNDEVSSIHNNISGNVINKRSLASAPSNHLFPPLWGCERDTLPPAAIHVVIATYNAAPEQLLPWLWHLGLTNAAVFVYYRTDDPSIRAMYDGTVQLPCNMSLNVLPLLPNKGREAAVFLHHIVTHFNQLPLALFLVHDHGPASRHSLCGPFFRRSRAFYRGLVVKRGPGDGDGVQGDGEGEEAATAAVGAGSERVVARVLGGRGRSRETARRTLFSRFASMVVTLSSGCIETWARGCCSAFLCSSSPRVCPFTAENCSHSEHRTGRQIFMHMNGLYDIRHENQIVDPEGLSGEAAAEGRGEGAARRPTALLRYVSSDHSFTDMWNISVEYPPDSKRLSKQLTQERLQLLLDSYNFTRRRRSTFKSCCASLIVRRPAILRWSLELYQELLSYSMDPTLDYEATKALSGPGWALWLDREYSVNDLLNYLRVDMRLRFISGCPDQFTPQMNAMVAQMRERAAEVATAAGGRKSGGGPE